MQQQTQQQQQTAMNNLKITDTKVGTGAEVKNGDAVNVLYSGSLDDLQWHQATLSLALAGHLAA